MAREIRITFRDDEKEIYDFIKSKSSASNFIKDLVKLEKERQENYTNAILDNNIEKIAEVLASKLCKVEVKEGFKPKKIEENKNNNKEKDEFDFDINDLD